MRLVTNRMIENKPQATVFNLEDNTLYIYDYIGSYKWYEEDTTVTANSFLNELKNVKGDLTVRINSQGGEVGNALAIYQMLLEHNGTVTTVIDGYAYSSASWIALAGSKRLINTGGLVMIHNPAMYAIIDSEDAAEKIMPQWNASRDSISMIISERTGLKIDNVKNMMKETTFFTSKEAVDNGFCHEIANKTAEVPDLIRNSLPENIKKLVPELPKVNNELQKRSLQLRSKFLSK